jgi:hypothetical protein
MAKAGTAAKAETVVEPDLDDMFGGEPTELPDDLDDLLNDVVEDDSEAWVPTERGEGIVGIVVAVGSVRSDFAPAGKDPMVPTVTLECKDPEDPTKTVKLRVIGYSKVLFDKITEADPQKGDRMAFRYFGEKPIRRGPYAGKTYKHYEVAIRKAG